MSITQKRLAQQSQILAALDGGKRLSFVNLLAYTEGTTVEIRHALNELVSKGVVQWTGSAYQTIEPITDTVTDTPIAEPAATDTLIDTEPIPTTTEGVAE